MPDPEPKEPEPAPTFRSPDQAGEEWEIDVIELSREFGGLWGEQGSTEAGR